MDKEQFLALIQKYLAGEASLEEEQLLLNFYGSFQDSELWDEDTMGTRDEVEAKMLARLQRYVLETEQRIGEGNKVIAARSGTGQASTDIANERGASTDQRKIQTLWPRVAAVAAVAALAFGIWFFSGKYQDANIKTGSDYANDVAPGRNGATLTLANGNQVRLSEALNGELANEAGVAITKAANGQLVYEVLKESQDETGGKPGGAESNKVNTLTTDKGETYQVRLPDGTLVYLNAASSLSYTAQLNVDGVRKVKLEGEGYFEVAKDKKHPFVVETGKQEVEVLGTHFNINAYPNEAAVKTTLLEGSVKVRLAQSQQVLKPGYQAVVSEGKLAVQTADVANVVDWKNNEFILDNQDFQTSMREIARWYDLEVIYAEGVPLKIETGGGISRNSKLSSVLKLIESSGLVHFRIAGKKLYVTN